MSLVLLGPLSVLAFIITGLGFLFTFLGKRNKKRVFSYRFWQSGPEPIVFPKGSKALQYISVSSPETEKLNP